MLIFNEEKHTYTSVHNLNDKYISCSTIVGLFHKHFDRRYWGLYSALKNLEGDNFKGWKYLKEKTEDSILAILSPDWRNEALKEREKIWSEWDAENLRSRIDGTAFHNKMEHTSISTGKEEFRGDIWKTIDFKSVHLSMSIEELQNVNYYTDLEDGYYPELLLFSHELGIAGTSDRVFIKTIGKDRWVFISDYKGFALDTPIATKEGWKVIGDIVEGDEIFDGEGKITKVKNVSEIHNNPCFKIVFDTNDELICDHEHKWEILQDNKKGRWIEKTITTENIFNSFDQTNTNKNFKIKCTNIELPDINLPLDPYVLGVWLADGNRTCGTITCLNQKTWDEIEKRGFKTSIDHNRKEDNKAESRTVFGLRTYLRELNLIGNKHLPIQYYRASHKQRLDLLRGLMDGDGHFNRLRKRCVMNTTKKWQADLIVELASSLGYKPTIIYATASGFGKVKIPAWQVCFSPSESPFLTRNEDYEDFMKDVNKERTKYRYIKSIEKVETVPTKCLAVESELHTYLIGKSFIKTHNTNKAIKTENKYDKMLYPFLQLMDTNHSHYSVQISLYGYLLELMGFKVAYTEFTHNISEEDVVVYEIDYEKIRPLVILMLEEYRKVLPQCKEYFNFLLHTDSTLQDHVEELINNTENIEHGIETYKFDNEDEFKDNLMRYLCKSFIQENRN